MIFLLLVFEYLTENQNSLASKILQTTWYHCVFMQNKYVLFQNKAVICLWIKFCWFANWFSVETRSIVRSVPPPKNWRKQGVFWKTWRWSLTFIFWYINLQIVYYQIAPTQTQYEKLFFDQKCKANVPWLWPRRI